MKPLHSKKLYAIYAESQSESRMKKYLACSKGNVQLAIARYRLNNEFDLQIIYQFEDIIWRHSSWLGFQPEDLHTKLPNFTNE
jgi:hypothetical protein